MLYRDAKPIYQEINKLDELLTEHNIPHDFANHYCGVGFQIRLYADAAKTKQIDDCIYTPYSHGYQLGLLETYYLNDTDGYETAEEVFAGWLEMYNKWLDK